MTSRMPYAAFDQLPPNHVRAMNTDLTVAFAPGELQLSEARVLSWVKRSAEIVGAYYGHFPVDTARILMVPVAGAGVRNGTTYGYRGTATKINIGTDTTERQLDNDWVLIHEMVHFAFPDTDDSHLWFSEGQATYIESVARVQAGARPANEVWGEFVEQMPKGLPQAGDAGLDRTHTWGRTYWGGALFCLLADVEIRKRTHDRFGLQDALRAVVNAGGVNTEDWELEKALKIGDAAVGVPVLEELYEKLRAAPGNIDLDRLWRDLGIRVDGKTVSFDDKAPLASARKAIMKSVVE
ncbi:MAG TPA: hypothetical protein VGN07_10655 [Steroidobacteraceae bacterium]